MEYDWEKKIRPAEWELFFYNMPDWLLPKGVYVAGVVLAHDGRQGKRNRAILGKTALCT